MMLEGFHHEERKNERHIEVPDENIERIEERSYRLESGITVDLIAKEFPYHGEEADHSKAIIFLPGWSIKATDSSIEEICRAYAERGKERTIAISASSPDEGAATLPKSTDFLNEEARAVARYIEGSGIENVKLIGHSKGGDEAIDVAAILEEESTISVEGLGLIDSSGLYEQEEGAMSALREHVMRGIPNEDEETRQRREKVLSEIRGNMFSEMIHYPWTFFSRLGSQVEGVSGLNPRAKKVKAPVVIITATDDPVADPERIVPKRAEKRLRTSLGEEAGKSNKTMAAREQFLQKHIFKSSPYVRMRVSEKMPHHMLPLLRPEQVVDVSLYEFERAHRKPTLQ